MEPRLANREASCRGAAPVALFSSPMATTGNRSKRAPPRDRAPKREDFATTAQPLSEVKAFAAVARDSFIETGEPAAMPSALSRLWFRVRTRFWPWAAAPRPSGRLRPIDIINPRDNGDVHRWADRFGVSAAELREVLLEFDQIPAPAGPSDIHPVTAG